MAEQANDRKGTLEKVKDANGRILYYRGRVRLKDGTRARVDIPEAKRTNEKAARLYIEWAQEREDRTNELWKAKQARDATVERDDSRAAGDLWFDAWEASRNRKGLTSTKDNRGHYTHHIRPALGGKHVRDWTQADMRMLVNALDAKVQSGALAWKSATNVWMTVTKMCSDAVSSKLDALRVRDDDPTARVEGPDAGTEKQRQFLYPSEFLKFVSCEAVPMQWRIAVTLAIYLYPRDGELRVLEWPDIDVEHRGVKITRAWSRQKGATGTTKSGRARGYPYEHSLHPLFEGAAGRAGLVINLPSMRDMARGLRGWLLNAGVTRKELHEDTPTTARIDWHDLRATGITWRAVRGDAPLSIMQAAGHADFATTQIYIRTAEALREGFGDVFPPLPSSLSLSTASDGGSGGGPVVRTTPREETSGRALSRRIGPVPETPAGVILHDLAKRGDSSPVRPAN